jgi:tetratricopeptide (TPR) repeat protein
MKQIGRNLILLATLIVMIVPVVNAQQTADTMSFWQARRAIITASEYSIVVSFKGSWLGRSNPNSVRVTSESFAFDATDKKGKTKHFVVAFKDISRIYSSCEKYECVLYTSLKTKFNIKDTEAKEHVIDFGWTGTGVLCDQARNVSDCKHSAGWFADALNSLHAYAIAHPNAPGDFQQQAAAWRLLATKPTLAEEVRLYRLAAEDAIKTQKPGEALNYYELGVEADPMWAQGWYNAALIAGQLGYFDDAAEHMRNYLELMPDAPDAQSARDQIDLWKFKALKK